MDKNWHNKGLNYINDLLSENGNFLSQTEIEQTYNIKTNFVQFQGMMQAVKLYLRRNNVENITKKIGVPNYSKQYSSFHKFKERRKRFLYNLKQK